MSFVWAQGSAKLFGRVKDCFSYVFTKWRRCSCFQMIFRKCERLFFVMFFTGGGGERVSVFSCFQKNLEV